MAESTIMKSGFNNPVEDFAQHLADQLGKPVD